MVHCSYQGVTGKNFLFKIYFSQQRLFSSWQIVCLMKGGYIVLMWILLMSVWHFLVCKISS